MLAGLLAVAVGVVYAVRYWYVTVPVVIVVGWLIGAGRKAGSRAQAARAAQVDQQQAEAEAARREAGRQWATGPTPALQMPGRFTERWLAENVPGLHPGQVPVLFAEMRARGWDDARITQRVQPYLAINPHIP